MISSYNACVLKVCLVHLNDKAFAITISIIINTIIIIIINIISSSIIISIIFVIIIIITTTRPLPTLTSPTWRT